MVKWLNRVTLRLGLNKNLKKKVNYYGKNII